MAGHTVGNFGMRAHAAQGLIRHLGVERAGAEQDATLDKADTCHQEDNCHCNSYSIKAKTAQTGWSVRSFHQSP